MRGRAQHLARLCSVRPWRVCLWPIFRRFNMYRTSGTRVGAYGPWDGGRTSYVRARGLEACVDRGARCAHAVWGRPPDSWACVLAAVADLVARRRPHVRRRPSSSRSSLSCAVCALSTPHKTSSCSHLSAPSFLACNDWHWGVSVGNHTKNDGWSAGAPRPQVKATE